MRKKRIKIKFKNIVVILLVFSGVILLLSNLPKDKEKFIEKDNLISDFSGMTLADVMDYGKKNSMEVQVIYQHNDLSKDKVIDGYIENNVINIVVSKGKITADLYLENKVNELGKVPIMMYHGIVDVTETKYVGGNVDKDGYNRTSDAFRSDLEFYYQNGYRMIRLKDYIEGIVDVPLGYSPIVLTFDDGNKNNFNVLGRNSDGSLKIDPNCAVGILESFKEKYNVNATATFFVMNNLFNQSEYNEEIMKWLVEHGYDIGNHTTNHSDFTKIGTDKTEEVVGKMYQKLDSILGDKYVKIIALPFGSPYKKTHSNYPFILNGSYNGRSYETIGALRVGWESEVSPFDKSFDQFFLKRCRAYDNNGKEFDIEMVFNLLEKNRYISDGDKDLVVVPKSAESKLNSKYKNIFVY